MEKLKMHSRSYYYLSPYQFITCLHFEQEIETNGQPFEFNAVEFPPGISDDSLISVTDPLYGAIIFHGHFYVIN